MPRADRICFEGAIYHVLQRGTAKCNIFLDDVDRWHLLKLFLDAKKRFGFIVHCYALMMNHFHITIETPNTVSISKIMQTTAGGYAMYFNKRHGRVGHLFQGRFKDIIVEKDAYLLGLSRYIHLNPVKAGIVDLPEKYRWTSYGIYLGMRKDVLVDTAAVFSYFDNAGEKSVSNKYKSFIEDDMERFKNDPDWIEKNLTKNRFLASDKFINKLSIKGV